MWYLFGLILVFVTFSCDHNEEKSSQRSEPATPSTENQTDRDEPIHKLPQGANPADHPLGADQIEDIEANQVGFGFKATGEIKFTATVAGIEPYRLNSRLTNKKFHKVYFSDDDIEELTPQHAWICKGSACSKTFYPLNGLPPGLKKDSRVSVKASYFLISENNLFLYKVTELAEINTSVEAPKIIFPKGHVTKPNNNRFQLINFVWKKVKNAEEYDYVIKDESTGLIISQETTKKTGLTDQDQTRVFQEANGHKLTFKVRARTGKSYSKWSKITFNLNIPLTSQGVASCKAQHVIRGSNGKSMPSKEDFQCNMKLRFHFGGLEYEDRDLKCTIPAGKFFCRTVFKDLGRPLYRIKSTIDGTLTEKQPPQTVSPADFILVLRFLVISTSKPSRRLPIDTSATRNS